MGRLKRATNSVLVAGILGVTGALVLAQAPTPAPAPAPAAPAAAAQGAPPANAPGTVKGTPANDTVKGAQLLAEARKALGGDDKFKGVQRLEVKGKSARVPQGNTSIEGDFEYSFELPDKFRHKENLGLSDISIDILQLLNGQEATTKTEMGGAAANIGGFDDGGNRGRGGRGGRSNDIVRFLTGGAASDDPEVNRKALATQMARLVMALTLSTSEPVAWIGVAESPDGRADVLEFKTPDGVPTHLVLDEKTHMPLMLTWMGTVQQPFNRGGGSGGGGNFRGGGPPNFPQSQSPAQAQQQGRRGGATAAAPQAQLQMHLSDYKTVNGMKFPHLIQSGANNETTEELVVKSLRVNPSFRADLFTK